MTTNETTSLYGQCPPFGGGSRLGGGAGLRMSFRLNKIDGKHTDFSDEAVYSATAVS